MPEKHYDIAYMQSVLKKQLTLRRGEFPTSADFLMGEVVTTSFLLNINNDPGRSAYLAEQIEKGNITMFTFAQKAAVPRRNVHLDVPLFSIANADGKSHLQLPSVHFGVHDGDEGPRYKYKFKPQKHLPTVMKRYIDYYREVFETYLNISDISRLLLSISRACHQEIIPADEIHFFQKQQSHVTTDHIVDAGTQTGDHLMKTGKQHLIQILVG